MTTPIRLMSRKQLETLIRDAKTELNARRRANTDPEIMKAQMVQYQKEQGIKDGDPWADPTSPLLFPQKDALRTHKGRLWRSTVDHNSWEPGVSGWKMEPETDPETGETIWPPFVRPSGAHDSYRKGWRITGEDGNVYAANRDGVDWPPEVAPQDWDLVEPEPEPEPEPPEDEEPEPEEPTDPEEPEPGDGEGDEDDEPTEPEEPEPEEPSLPEWAPNQDYTAGDELTYDGAPYRVIQPHRSADHWRPDAVPALYERL